MKNKLYESILQNITDELKNNNENKNTAFHVFIDAMHGKTVYDTDGPCGDLNDALPTLKVTEMGLMKMFQYKYSENDEYIKLLTELADKIHYSNFAETVCRNSIEAKKRYQDSHICKTYIVAGTCNWPCTIKATEMDGLLNSAMMVIMKKQYNTIRPKKISKLLINGHLNIMENC